MWWEDIPVLGIFAVLWTVAMLRGQATYALARWATEATIDETADETSFRARLAGWLNRPMPLRARRLLEGWGWPAISLSYLTVGLQTALLAAAGVLRMSWLKFTAAQFIGAVGWAAIYTTIGATAWQAVLGGVSGTTWLIIVAAIGLVLLATYTIKRIQERRRELRRTAETDVLVGGLQ